MNTIPVSVLSFQGWCSVDQAAAEIVNAPLSRRRSMRVREAIGANA
jgi:hypothetical protein